MTQLIACLSTGKGTWTTIARIISSEDWENLFLITNEFGKEKFNAKNPRSMMLRQPGGAHMGYVNCTKQRPLNNLTRSVVGAIASALSGGPPNAAPPFDEPLGLGWSLEAIQLSEDAGRILQYESKLTEVSDPLAGSYYVESLTNRMEEEIQKIIDDVESRGGMTAAVRSGWIDQAIEAECLKRQQIIGSGPTGGWRTPGFSPGTGSKKG